MEVVCLDIHIISERETKHYIFYFLLYECIKMHRLECHRVSEGVSLFII